MPAQVPMTTFKPMLPDAEIQPGAIAVKATNQIQRARGRALSRQPLQQERDPHEDSRVADESGDP